MSESVMAARPGSVSVTPQGGSAVVITDIIDWEPIDDPEIIEDQSGESQYDYHYQGKLVQGIKFTTGDLNVLDKIQQGTYFSAASATMKGVIRADGSKKVSAAVLTMTLTNGVVLKLGKPKAAAGDGKPKRFEVELRVGHSNTGTEGSGVLTVALADE